MEKFQLKHFQTNETGLDPWYVTGFADGESAFTYSRAGRTLNLYFAIKLVFEDRELLYKIRSFFGVGRIYVGRPVEPKKFSGHTRTSFYYRVSRIRDLDRIIEHFDEYPLVGKKARSYAIWKEMAQIKKAYRRPDREKLNALSAQLSQLTGRKPNKRTNAENSSDL